MASSGQNDRYSRALALFDLLASKGRRARASMMRQIEISDPDIAPLLGKMLRSFDLNENLPCHDFIEKAYVNDLIDDAKDRLVPGSRVGPWIIGKEIGYGGMGIVYEAERQADDFTQRCALKISHTQISHTYSAERFLIERQLLARLQHPRIAMLLDGGVSNGFPWLAMEYVNGVSITKWVATQELSPKDAVKLFLQALAAVAYAHEHLIVHGDIKPSNMLVNQEGQLKLLDFGLASVIGGAPAVDAPPAFSPQYAAPEQFWQTRPIGTKADIYALGLVLYEITHGKPFHKNSLISRVVSSGDARRSDDKQRRHLISAVFLALGEKFLVIGRNVFRSTQVDLLKIVSHCVENEPAARYASVNDLTRDLRYWLDRRAISLRNRPAHRLIHFFQRHKWVFPSLAAFLLISALKIADLHNEVARAEVEIHHGQLLNRGAMVSQFFDDTLYNWSKSGGDISRMTIPQYANLLKNQLDNSTHLDPLVKSRAYANVADFYASVGMYNESLDAIKASRDSGQQNDIEKALSLIVEARVNRSLGHYTYANLAINESQALINSYHPASDLYKVESRAAVAHDMASVHLGILSETLLIRFDPYSILSSEDSSDRVALFERLLTDFGSADLSDFAHGEWIHGLSNMNHGDLAEALSRLHKSKDLYRINGRIKSSDHSRVDKDISLCLFLLGKFQESLNVLSEYNLDMVNAKGALGIINVEMLVIRAKSLAEIGRDHDAAKAALIGADLASEVLPADSPNRYAYQADFADILFNSGSFEEARKYNNEVLRFNERYRSNDNYYSAILSLVIASKLSLIDQDVKSARAFITSALDILSKLKESNLSALGLSLRTEVYTQMADICIGLNDVKCATLYIEDKPHFPSNYSTTREALVYKRVLARLLLMEKKTELSDQLFEYVSQEARRTYGACSPVTKALSTREETYTVALARSKERGCS